MEERRPEMREGEKEDEKIEFVEKIVKGCWSSLPLNRPTIHHLIREAKAFMLLLSFPYSQSPIV